MSRRRRSARVAACLALACACTSVQESDVPLPPLAGADEPIVAAVAEAREQVRATPNSSAAWGRLGDLLLAHGWAEHAVPAYAAASERDPASFDWAYRWGVSLGATDDRQAEETIRAALRVDPSYAPAHCSLGEVLQRQGRVAEARAAYESALQLEPESVWALLRLGQLATEDGRLDEGRRLLETAVRLREDQTEAWRSLARVYFALGHADLAAQVAARAASMEKASPREDPRATPQLEPLGAVAWVNEGAKREAAGDLRGALTAYEEALRVRPDSPTAHYDLGSLLVRSGNVGAGLEHLQEAVRLHPSYAKAWLNLGATMSDLGRPGEAEDALRRALELDEGLVVARLQLARVLAPGGRSAEAVDQLRLALEQRPGWPRAAGELAWLLATAPDGEVRNGAEAARIAEVVCRDTGYRVPEAVDALAAAYAELGRYEEAADLLRRVLQTDARAATAERTVDMRARLQLYESGHPYHAPRDD